MTAVGIPAAAHLDLAATVLAWFRSSGRDLAFRRTTDPWAVLVSEVMAQQTQAGRAAAAWTAFMRRYPTPAALAAASPAEVIRACRQSRSLPGWIHSMSRQRTGHSSH